MKKFNFSKLAAALAASAMILTAAFTGCSSSSSGGGGGDDEDGKIESVSITPSTTDSVESGSPVTLTATVTGDISDDNVTYAWKVTENADYGTLSATDGKEVTLTLTNEDENAHIVKVTLTATNKNDVENTAADNAYVTVKGKDGSSELPESEKELEEEKEEEEKKEAEAGKTGTVSIKVAVDDSENPTYTVIFNDTAEEGYTAQESVTKTVEYGDTVAAPEWTRDGYSLTWTSSVDGVTVNSDITADVAFTANWTENAKYTVTFEDSDGTNTTVTQTVYEGKNATVPAWTKEGFNLTWTSSVSGLTPTSAITANVTFTATWSKDATSWTAGDEITPSWISGLGTAAKASRDVFKEANGSAFTNAVSLTSNGTFTIKPSIAGTYVIYICGDNNNANKGTATAKYENKTLGDEYKLPGRKDSSATPWKLTITSDYIGKEITVSVSYASLLFKVDIQ